MDILNPKASQAKGKNGGYTNDFPTLFPAKFSLAAPGAPPSGKSTSETTAGHTPLESPARHPPIETPSGIPHPRGKGTLRAHAGLKTAPDGRTSVEHRGGTPLPQLAAGLNPLGTSPHRGASRRRHSFQRGVAGPNNPFPFGAGRNFSPGLNFPAAVKFTTLGRSNRLGLNPSRIPPPSHGSLIDPGSGRACNGTTG